MLKNIFNFNLLNKSDYIFLFVKKCGTFNKNYISFFILYIYIYIAV